MTVKTQDIVMKPKSWLKAPRHSRSVFDQAALRDLSANIEVHGMMNPIECLPTGEIVAGHRRWQASLMSDKITEVPVRIMTDLTVKDIRIRRISENLHRADVSFWDKYVECRGFLDDEPGTTGKQIAAALNVDESTITRYLCLDRCIPEVKQAASEEKIGMKSCYEISKEPPERQPALLAHALSGSAVQVAKARNDGTGTAPSAKPGKGSSKPREVKILLPGGKAVIARGVRSLAEAADLFRQVAKDAADAKAKGQDAAAFESMMRHRALAADSSATLV